MARAIVDAELTVPAWEHSGLRVEGPDEDGLTMTVEVVRRASERHRAGAALVRLDIVGAIGDDQDWAVREALGLPALAVHHNLPGPGSVFAALVALAHDPTAHGAAALVVVDRSVPGSETSPGRTRPSGASAVALWFDSGSGLVPRGHADRAHPEWRRPDAKEWCRTAVALVPDREGRVPPHLLFVAAQPAPVLLNFWEPASRGGTWSFHADEVPHLGVAPSISAPLALRWLADALSPGHEGVVAIVDGNRTAFLAVGVTGSIDWHGPWTDPGGATGISAPPALTGPVPIHAVSEGAYIPRPTYVADLPSRWRLAADRCPKCGRLSFPARGVCRFDGTSEGLSVVELPREGLEVRAVTTIFPEAQPTEFDAQVERGGPYSVVIAQAAPSVRVTLQVADVAASSVRVGDRVDVQLRRLYPMEGEWRYGLKAVPSAAPSAPPRS